MSTQYVLDGVQLTSTLAIGAVFAYRWLWVCAAFTAVGGTIGFVRPDLVHLAFAVANCAAILLGALLLPRSRASGRDEAAGV